MIALISTTHGRGLGAEAVLDALLSAWRSAEMRLTVVAPPGSRAAQSSAANGHGFLPLNTSHDGLAANLLGLRAVLPKLRGARLVHAWSARSFELARLAARLGRVPSCGTLHDHPRAGFIGPARRRLMRWSANRLGALVCVSRAVEGAVRSAGYRVPTRVVWNGLPDRPPVSLSRARESGPPRIGFTGLYAEWKGFDTVAEWAAETRHDRAEWRLYGRPGGAPESRVRALAAACRGSVKVCGFRPSEEIFAEIDILVHPSTAFDPFPTALLEAARAGIPTVASRAGGSPEIVEEDRTGFLFQSARPADGLERLRALIADADLRVRMGQAARCRFLERFQAVRMAEEYRAAWHSLLAGEPPDGVEKNA